MKSITIGPHGTSQREYIDLVFPGKFGERILKFGRSGTPLTVSGTEHEKEFRGRHGPSKVNEIFVTSLELGNE